MTDAKQAPAQPTAGASGLEMRVERVVAPVRRQVADQIRDAIVQSRFAASQRLTERELTELTGVSRPTVREALQQLAAEGLVDTLPGRGWIVATLTTEEAKDLYAVRAVIEGLAGRRFVERAAEKHLDALDAAVTEMEQAFEDLSSMTAMLAAKERFYDALFVGAQSQTVTMIIVGLHARVSMLRARSLSPQGRPAESLREIQAIRDALRSRDADRAGRACAHHVEQAARVALASMAEADELGGKRAQETAHKGNGSQSA